MNDWAIKIDVLSDIIVLLLAAPSDYTALSNLPLVFPARSVAGDTQRFSVTIIDDSLVELDEVFTLSSSDNNPRAQNLQSTSLGIIGNDDCKLSIRMNSVLKLWLTLIFLL